MMSGSADSRFSSPRYLSLYASFNIALNADIVAKWKKWGFLSFGSGSAFIIFDHVTFFVCGSNDELRFFSTNSANFPGCSARCAPSGWRRRMPHGPIRIRPGAATFRRSRAALKF